MMIDIVFLGPPGAGKGTQARILAGQKYRIKQISTGDILRSITQPKTDMAKRALQSMQFGQLVPDDVVIGLIGETIEQTPNTGFVFDGFPRTLNQADALETMLHKHGRKVHMVVELNVDSDALVNRITKRLTCLHCGSIYNADTLQASTDNALVQCAKCGSSDLQQREDDTQDVLNKRLLEYYKKTAPLIGYYYAKNLLYTVNGLDDISTIADKIAREIDKRMHSVAPSSADARQTNLVL